MKIGAYIDYGTKYIYIRHSPGCLISLEWSKCLSVIMPQGTRKVSR